MRSIPGQIEMTSNISFTSFLVILFLLNHINFSVSASSIYHTAIHSNSGRDSNYRINPSIWGSAYEREFYDDIINSIENMNNFDDHIYNERLDVSNIESLPFPGAYNMVSNSTRNADTYPVEENVVTASIMPSAIATAPLSSSEDDDVTVIELEHADPFICTDLPRFHDNIEPDFTVESKKYRSKFWRRILKWFN